VINFRTPKLLRTGRTGKISLQYWDGYGVKARYEKYLDLAPGNLADSIDILAPNFTGGLQDDGSFGYCLPAAEARYLAALGQDRGVLVAPLVLFSGDKANRMLYDPAKRARFIDSALRLVQETGADGIMVDPEGLARDSGPGLTALMRDLYARLHPQGKLIMIAVMSRTSDASGYTEYNYSELAKHADYIQIMTYDFHYATSAPGAIAPLNWVRRVMRYAVSRIPSEKILMGIPYYGREWRLSGGKWTSRAVSLATALRKAQKYGVSLRRETAGGDSVGIPWFQYIDENSVEWTVYYDDGLSWREKLKVVKQYNLGGVGAWSMAWLDEGSAPVAYPLLREML
jgi:spore germination protein YaaH